MIGFLESLGVHPALIFFMIFAVVVILYGLVLYGTGDENWLPLRVQPTVAGPDDVRHVGKVTMITGAVILGVVIFGMAVTSKS